MLGCFLHVLWRRIGGLSANPPESLCLWRADRLVGRNHKPNFARHHRFDGRTAPGDDRKYLLIYSCIHIARNVPKFSLAVYLMVFCLNPLIFFFFISTQVLVTSFQRRKVSVVRSSRGMLMKYSTQVWKDEFLTVPALPPSTDDPILHISYQIRVGNASIVINVHF